MRLVDYLDKGASLGADRPCLTTDGASLSYGEVVDLSFGLAAALVARGVTPGDKVAILSANDPIAFSCLFGLSRAGPYGARSTLATRPPRIVSCSTSSTARW